MKNKHEFTIKIEGEDWEKAQDHAFQKRNKNAKIDGFRPGKAPKDVFIKHYGKESLYFDAADALLQVAYSRMLEKEKVIPVVEPKVDIKSINETGVEYIFTVITKPEVKIKKYKNLGVKKDAVKVSKEEITEEINKLLDRYTELVTKEKGKVEKGNVAVIDFEGFKDGKAFDGGKGENYSLEIGSNTFIPGFEDAVIGMKTGEEKDINVTFPEDYGEKSLAGCPVVFKVKVNVVKSKELPELNDAFASDVSEFETLAAYKEHIKEHLGEHAQEDAKIQTENEIIEKK